MHDTQFKERSWMWPCWLDNAAGQTLSTKGAFQIFHIQLNKCNDKLIEWPVIECPTLTHVKFHTTSRYVMHISINICTLCVSSQALPLHCHLCSLLTMPSLFTPRHLPYSAVCGHYLLCPVCFLPGTTITLQSVLSGYFPCLSSPACMTYTAIPASFLSCIYVPTYLP